MKTYWIFTNDVSWRDLVSYVSAGGFLKYIQLGLVAAVLNFRQSVEATQQQGGG
jgi:hypothetical protein